LYYLFVFNYMGSTRKPVDIEKITTENAKFFKYTKFRKNTKFTKLCGL